MIEKKENMKKAAGAMLSAVRAVKVSRGVEHIQLSKELAAMSLDAEQSAMVWQAFRGDTILTAEPSAWARAVKQAENWRVIKVNSAPGPLTLFRDQPRVARRVDLNRASHRPDGLYFHVEDLLFDWLIQEMKIDLNSKESCEKGLIRTTFAGISTSLHALVIPILLEHGANVDLRKLGSNNTYLVDVAFLGIEACVSGLPKGGADIEAGNLHGRTALWLAVYENEEKVVRLLLERGANVNDKLHEGKTKGMTPLYVATNKTLPGMRRLLLRHKTDVDCVDDEGSTPLNQAVFKGSQEIALMLVEGGADVIFDDDTERPFILAVQSGWPTDIVELIMKHGRDSIARSMFTPTF